ncbi:MAG TPA: hypothetical protein PKW41_13805, partial [Clostridia bacterium]|nr:hypothetical protein [Clostridia bacterium]
GSRRTLEFLRIETNLGYSGTHGWAADIWALAGAVAVCRKSGTGPLGIVPCLKRPFKYYIGTRLQGADELFIVHASCG